MATTISPGMGVALTIDTTAIGEVVSVSGPTYSRATIETTNLASANDFRTYMKGISDAGEISFQVQYDGDDAGQIKIMAEVEASVNATLKVFTLTLADDGTPSAWTAMFGILSKCDIGGMDIDGRITADITVKLSGVPTFVAG